MGTRLLANPAAPKNIRNLSGGKQFRPNGYTHLSTLYRCRRGLEFAPGRLSSTKSNLAVFQQKKMTRSVASAGYSVFCGWVTGSVQLNFRAGKFYLGSITLTHLWVCGFVVAWQCGLVDLVDRRFMPQDTWLTITNIAILSKAINQCSIKNVKCYQYSLVVITF